MSDEAGERVGPRLRCVTPALETRDLPRTIAFYRDVLGFTVHLLWPETNPTFCILDHGDVHLSFYVDEHGGEGEPIMTGQLRIDAVGVMAVFERVRPHAVIEWGPEVYHYGRREFSMKDPNGYSLIFSEPTSDPPTCVEDA